MYDVIMTSSVMQFALNILLTGYLPKVFIAERCW